jgi:hypothetical protein
VCTFHVLLKHLFGIREILSNAKAINSSPSLPTCKLYEGSQFIIPLPPINLQATLFLSINEYHNICIRETIQEKSSI